MMVLNVLDRTFYHVLLCPFAVNADDLIRSQCTLTASNRRIILSVPTRKPAIPSLISPKTSPTYKQVQYAASGTTLGFVPRTLPATGGSAVVVRHMRPGIIKIAISTGGGRQILCCLAA